MAVRPIDANTLYDEISKWPESVMYKDWVQSAIANATTLTPQNEWVSVEESNKPKRGELIVYADSTAWGFRYGVCRVHGAETNFTHWIPLSEPQIAARRREKNYDSEF